MTHDTDPASATSHDHGLGHDHDHGHGHGHGHRHDHDHDHDHDHPKGVLGLIKESSRRTATTRPTASTAPWSPVPRASGR